MDSRFETIPNFKQTLKLNTTKLIQFMFPILENSKRICNRHNIFYTQLTAQTLNLIYFYLIQSNVSRCGSTQSNRVIVKNLKKNTNYTLKKNYTIIYHPKNNLLQFKLILRLDSKISKKIPVLKSFSPIYHENFCTPARGSSKTLILLGYVFVSSVTMENIFYIRVQNLRCDTVRDGTNSSVGI